MGTYAKYLAQKHIDGEWTDIVMEDLPIQDYALFTMLANQRSDRHANIPPISEPRGLPEDSRPDEEETWFNQDTQLERLREWLGCPITWLTSTEILNHYQTHPHLVNELPEFKGLIEEEHDKHGEFRLIVGFD